MKKQLLALLLISNISQVSASEPAPADEKAQAPSGQVKDRIVALPKAVAGVMAGLVIGVPVRISKDVRRETRRLSSTLRSDVGNDFGLVETAFVLGGASIFGVLGGTILGTIHGTEQALTYGSHQPFSLESLSLKETAQEPDKK